jgi:glycosyltransferase involved in cell wall biosynthesis
MNPSTKISAVIITYNEEAHIAECLASLSEVVSEIVVVDSYSTDATKAICAQYSCRFIEHEWQGFSVTKNWANDQVFHEWIVSIDADEVLSPALILSIQEAQNNGLMDGLHISLID